MKKLFLLIICLLSFNAAGNIGDPVFDLNNEENFGVKTEQSFTGAPVVLIEKEEEQLPEVNKAELLPPPNIPKEKIQIPIKTPFGHSQKVAFINHITDYVSFIQLLDKDTVKITEQIQFVTTDKQTLFERSFPDINSDNIQILSVLRGEAPVSFEETEKGGVKRLILEKKLPKGVHRITIQYILKGLITHNKSLADLIIPILSGTQSDMVERLTAMVMLPQKADFYKKEPLFGSNNVVISDAVDITEDRSGSLIFQITHPLPAYTNMKIHLLMNSDALPSAPANRLSENHVMIGCYFLVLILYALLSIGVCRFKKWKKILLKSKKISPVLWIYGMGGNLTLNTLNYLKEQRIYLWGARQSRVWPRLISYFRFNWEYITGIMILILITKMAARYYDIIFTTWEKNIFILAGVICLMTIDIFGTQKELNNLKEKLKETLLNTPLGLNLAPRDIQTYYLKAVCFKFDSLWQKRLITNNPSYSQLSFFKKENRS